LSGTITPFNDIAPHEKYMFHLASHFSESLTNEHYLIVKLQYKDAVLKQNFRYKYSIFSSPAR